MSFFHYLTFHAAGGNRFSQTKQDFLRNVLPMTYPFLGLILWHVLNYFRLKISTFMRHLLPLSIRQDIKHSLRQIADVINRKKFDGSKGILKMQDPICIIQPIMPSAFYNNKLINITRGATLLDNSIIGANKNWSFWHRIKHPNTANGFVPGRNLVNGKLVAQVGGGLCQLSSMVYHLALLGGLTIVERHAHSVDIYEEDQRFTPLGADATVVWGFKDLRLYNPYQFPVSLKFRVEQGQLIGELNAETNLVAKRVDFIQIPLENSFVQINTIVNHDIQETTIYQQKRGMQVSN
jgi:vancomycin resistance protein VanW